MKHYAIIYLISNCPTKKMIIYSAKIFDEKLKIAYIDLW